MSSVARLFLAINGVTGESVDDSFKGKIELDDWSWDLKRKEKQEDTEARHGRYEPSELKISKSMDKSSTPLMNKLKSGEQFMATLTLIEDSDHPFELSAHLVNARVTDYSLKGKDESMKAGLEEDWTINYDKIHFEHTWEPVRNSSKTVTSSSLWRRPDASTGGSDAIKKLVESFRALKDPDKIDAAAQIKEKFPDAMKGQLPAQSKTSNSSSRVRDVIEAFESLSSSERKKARDEIAKL
jgi:type VI protein secretion system component Hcp